MNKKVALVLSSGGARGMAHIGVIQELLKNEFEIHSLAGSSMGAVVASAYATGKLDEFSEWMQNLNKIDVWKLLDFTVSGQGFIKGEKVFREMQKIIPDQAIEDLPIPLAIVAVDIYRHKERVFRDGSLYDALRATVAMPSVFEPFQYGENVYVDGGIMNPIPLNHVYRTENDILIGVNLNVFDSKHVVQKMSKKREKQYQLSNFNFMKKWRKYFPQYQTSDVKYGFFELMNQSFDTLQEQISSFTIADYPPDILVRIPRNEAGTFDFYKTSELIELGSAKFKEKYLEYCLDLTKKTNVS